MSLPLCSVVMATYNRAHLLNRSLICYERQDFDNDRFELVVIDDHSDDDTAGLVYDWSKQTGIKSVVITPHPKPEAWRDCGAILNIGIRASQGEHILLTHPEVMPGRRSVAECVERLAFFERFRGTNPQYAPGSNGAGMYACCKPYYLSQRDQERIDTVDWVGEGPLAVRKIEGFYDEQPGHPDYQPRAIESVGKPGAQHSHWLSWVFGGCSRRTWREIGGFAQTSTWGACDVLWVQRRRLLGIVNHTCIDDDTLVVHQSHDDPNSNVLTPRIEDVWKQELAGIPVHDRVAMTADHLGWRS